jgi:hypothetical protein
MTKRRERSLFSGEPEGYYQMMNHRIGFLTARIAELRPITAETDKAGQKKIALLSNGVIPDEEQENFKRYQTTFNESEDPLRDAKIASFNNWFALHPEKVAGKEVITSSREFPVTIKGKREEIDAIFSFLGKDNPGEEDLELEALEIELKLLQY